MTTATLNKKKLFAYLIVDDIEMKEELLKKAQDGDVSSLSKIAEIYYKKEGYTKAIDWFRLAAAGGHVYSQYKIGHMYEEGQGIPRDYETAMEWYSKAYNNGYSMAGFSIGRLYYLGNGVRTDIEVALKWLHEASIKGIASANRLIGHCYKTGYGVHKDKKYALEWYEKSSCSFSNQEIKSLNEEGVYITDRQRRCMQTQKGLEEQKLKVEWLEQQLMAAELKQLKTDVEINQLKQQIEALKLICNIDANNPAFLEEENTDKSSETASNTTGDWARTTTDEESSNHY